MSPPRRRLARKDRERRLRRALDVRRARAARLRRGRPRRVAAHGPPGDLELQGDGGGHLPRPRGRRPPAALRGRVLLALLAQVLRGPDGGPARRPLRAPRAARGNRGDRDCAAEDGQATHEEEVT